MDTYQGLDVQEEQSDDAVVRLIDPVEVYQGIDRRSKGTVKPSSTLPNELSSIFRDISLSLAGLDICKSPFLVFLCDELKAQDPVFGYIKRS